MRIRRDKSSILLFSEAVHPLHPSMNQPGRLWTFSSVDIMTGLSRVDRQFGFIRRGLLLTHSLATDNHEDPGICRMVGGPVSLQAGNLLLEDWFLP